MSNKVSPEVMQRDEKLPVCPQTFEYPQKHYSNGCPMQCCGDGPKPFTVEQLKGWANDSTKWIQKPDGRVIEYFTYGSDSPDATANGSSSTGSVAASSFSRAGPNGRVISGSCGSCGHSAGRATPVVCVCGTAMLGMRSAVAAESQASDATMEPNFGAIVQIDGGRLRAGDRA